MKHSEKQQPQHLPLYGRSNEIELLRRQYEISRQTKPADTCSSPNARSATSNRPQLVLLSGPAGVGKRSLVKAALADVVESTGGIYLVGRFRPSHCQQGEGGRNREVDNVHGTSIQTTFDTTSNVASNLPRTDNRPLAAFCDLIRSLAHALESSSKEALIRPQLQRYFSSNDLDGVLRLSSSSVTTNSRPATDRSSAAEVERESCVSTVATSSINTTGCASSSGSGIRPFLLVPPMSMPKERCVFLARLIHIVASIVPVVLSLEQLEYAGPSALLLLQELLQNQTRDRDDDGMILPLKGLLIVASYRDDDGNNSMKPTETQVQELDGVNEDQVQKIHLSNLDVNDIHRWIVDHLVSNFGECHGVSDERIQSMADDFYSRTSGNPQFVRFLLRDLNMSSSKGSPSPCPWENELFQIAQPTKSISDVFIDIVEKSDVHLRDVIKVLSALGECGEDSVDIRILDMVLQESCEDTIQNAQEQGLLELAYDRIHFSRPELQMAAYTALIPKCDRAAYHLRIGRRIWKNSSLGSHCENENDNVALLFILVRNLQLGIELVADGHELDMIVALSLDAGRQAMRRSAFADADSFFEFGLSVLGDKEWRPGWYDITLTLYNCASETSYCTAKLERMEELLSAIFQNAATFQDKLQAYTAQVFSYGSLNRLEAALSTAFKVLHGLNEPIPTNPDLRMISAEFVKTRWLLRRKTDRFFHSLPDATNADKVAAMQMLNFTMMYAYECKPNSSLLAGFRIIQLCLIHGMAPPAISAFAFYGYLLCAHLGKIEEGFRYGQIALTLLDQCQSKAWLPRVYLFVYGLIGPFKFPLRDCLGPLQMAYRSAFNTGDLEAGMINASMYIQVGFHMGLPLAELAVQVRACCHVTGPFGQSLGTLCLIQTLSIVCELMGDTDLKLNGDVRDTCAAFKRAVADGNRIAVFHYFLYRLKHHCLCGRYHDALLAARKAWDAISDADPWLTFYEGLSALAAARHSSQLSSMRYIRLGRRAIKRLKNWARVCPANCENKHALLEAEWNGLKGKVSKALSWFNASIEVAKREGFVHEEGLAYERLALFHCHEGNHCVAALCFEAAKSAYQRWGALVLAERMNEHLVQISMPSTPLPRNDQSSKYYER